MVNSIRCPWPGCTRSFTRRFRFAEHHLTHTGEKPFKCTRCPAAFLRRHDHQEHEIGHTNTKRFVCKDYIPDDKTIKGCSHAFTRMSTLRRHQRSQACSGQSTARPLETVPEISPLPSGPESSSTFAETSELNAGVIEMPSLSPTTTAEITHRNDQASHQSTHVAASTSLSPRSMAHKLLAGSIQALRALDKYAFPRRESAERFHLFCNEYEGVAHCLLNRRQEDDLRALFNLSKVIHYISRTPDAVDGTDDLFRIDTLIRNIRNTSLISWQPRTYIARVRDQAVEAYEQASNVSKLLEDCLRAIYWLCLEIEGHETRQTPGYAKNYHSAPVFEKFRPGKAERVPPLTRPSLIEPPQADSEPSTTSSYILPSDVPLTLDHLLQTVTPQQMGTASRPENSVFSAPAYNYFINLDNTTIL